MSNLESLLEGIVIRLLAGSFVPLISKHTSWKIEVVSVLPEKVLGNGSRGSLITCHSVWGRVVPDIPDFCRELVAALAEQ